MYLTFYGLREKPFNTTPDPKFLYLTPGHREALAQLLYGVQESKGFIVLTGQVGTGKTTLVHALRQLKQRIGLRCHIPPLSREQAREYIRSRLRVAGAQDLRLFSDQAVKRIAEYARGIPRLVNILCDHCLLFGFADQKRRVDRDTVGQAIKYLEEGTRPKPSPRTVLSLVRAVRHLVIR